MGDDRPPVYYEDDEQGNSVLIIRTSAIGSSCMWELVAAGQGYDLSPVPANLQRAFDEGNRLEPLIIRMLEKDYGYNVWGEQAEGHLEVEPGLKIRYHPDGFINKPGLEARILEVKALSDVLWQKAVRGSVGDCIGEYNWQASVMMHEQGKSLTWVAYNKGNADGQPCADEGKLHFETLNLPPIPLDDIINKARMVKEQVEGEDILVSGRACDDPNHYPCRFLYIRPEPEGMSVSIDGTVSQVPKPEFVEVAEVEQEEVDRLVREYLMFKGQVDEAKTRMEAAKEALIEKVGEGKGLLTDKWIVPVITGTNTSPDWAAMPEEVATEAKKYKKSTKYKYLKGIKPRG